MDAWKQPDYRGETRRKLEELQSKAERSGDRAKRDFFSGKISDLLSKLKRAKSFSDLEQVKVHVQTLEGLARKERLN